MKYKELWKQIQEYEMDWKDCSDTTIRDNIRLELSFLYKQYCEIFNMCYRIDAFNIETDTMLNNMEEWVTWVGLLKELNKGLTEDK